MPFSTSLRALRHGTGTCSRHLAVSDSIPGVDPYTAHVAHFVASFFRLGPQGSIRVRNALSQLPCLRGYGSVLWFGVGIQSLIRLMSKTDEGCIWIALSAALAECYHEEIAAEILHEMVLILKPPERLVPSVMEWLMLVRASESSLKLSNFGVRAETLMSLCRQSNPSHMLSGHDKRRNTPELRGCSAPSQLAAAIMALGKVSVAFPILASSSWSESWRPCSTTSFAV